MLTIVLTVPFFCGLFHFGPLHPADGMLMIAAGVTGILWFELLKALRVRLG
jgi:hypothetical protein